MYRPKKKDRIIKKELERERKREYEIVKENKNWLEILVYKKLQ